MKALQWYWSEMLIYLRYLHQEMVLDIAEIHRRYPQYPKTTLYWHMKQDVKVDVDNSPTKNSGQPRVLFHCVFLGF